MSKEHSSEGALIRPDGAGSGLRGERAAEERSETGRALALAVRDIGNPPLRSIQFLEI